MSVGQANSMTERQHPDDGICHDCDTGCGCPVLLDLLSRLPADNPPKGFD